MPPPPPQPQQPPPQVNTTSTSTSNSTTTNNKEEQDGVDPIRDWLSSLITGLELLFESIRSLLTSTTHSSTKQIVLKLSLRCLILQTTLSILSSIASTLHNGGGFMSHTQLFFPYILFYRYLFPKRWDQLFTSTVRSLNCTNRSDIVAKPSPRYFVQLKGFLRRMAKAHVELKLLNWLVHGRTASVFYYPSAVLALLASYSYLKSKQVVFFWKPAFVLAFLLGAGNIHAAGPIWLVQTIYLQDWLLYELLQPYLARVQFKPWEEKAWLDRYQTELYGFVLGAWLICNIPWIGVAAIPALFPAMAFLLTRSCGSMENTSQGRSAGRTGAGLGTGTGDLIERRAPGVKQVAQGTHPSVRGDWDSIKVLTMVQSDPDYALQAIRDFQPRNHDLNWKNSSLHYSVDKGFDSALTHTQIEEDRIRSQSAREALYREAEREAHRQFRGGFRGVGGFGGPSFQGRGGFGRGPWDMRMDPRFAMHSHTAGPSSSSSLSSFAPASGSTTTTESIFTPTSSSIHSKDNKAATGNYNSLEGEDLTRYNFSDRKTLDSAPSAPREEDLLPSEPGARASGQNSMYLDPTITTTHHTRTHSSPNPDHYQLAGDRDICVQDQEKMFRDQERMIRDQEHMLRDQENLIRSRENRIRAQENQRRAAEQIRRALSQTDGGGGRSRRRDEEPMEDGDETHETHEEEEEEEYHEAQEDAEDDYQEENVDEAFQPSTRGFGFSRGDRGGRGMLGFTPRGRGGRGGTGGSGGDGGRSRGVNALRGFMRGIATRGQERGIGRWGRGASRRSQSQSQQGQDQEQWQGRGHDRLRSRSIPDNHRRHPTARSSGSSTDNSSPISTPAPSTRSQQQASDTSTPSAAPDFSHLSETITQGMAQFEHQLNQRMHAWGNQWVQKLRDAVTDPDNPGVYRFKYETS